MGETLLSWRARLEELQTTENNTKGNEHTEEDAEIGGFARVAEVARGIRPALGEAADAWRAGLQQSRTAGNDNQGATTPRERKKPGSISWIVGQARWMRNAKVWLEDFKIKPRLGRALSYRSVVPEITTWSIVLNIIESTSP